MLTSEQFEALCDRQERMELEASAAGIARFKAKVQDAKNAGMEQLAGGASDLFERSIMPTIEALDAWVESQRTTRGPKHMALKWVQLVGCDVAAYCTAQAIFSAFSTTRQAGHVAINVTNSILDELRFRRFQEQAPGLYKYKVHSYEAIDSLAYRKRNLKQSMKHLRSPIDLSDLSLSARVKATIGMKLIDVFRVATGLIALQTVTEQVPKTDVKARAKVRSKLTIEPTEETQEWMARRNGALEDLFPVAMPMIVPPLPWAKGEIGGFRYRLRQRFQLVRSARSKAPAQDVPVVYSAINRIQNAAWKVNRDVLDLAVSITERGHGMGVLPDYAPKEMPILTPEVKANKEAFSAWKQAYRDAKRFNWQRTGDVRESDRTIRAAQALADELAIWFPHSMDFRGRIYPMVTRLNPQGSDIHRGLLTFAQGKPLGGDGAAWLAIHGANCMDDAEGGVKLSKVSFQERIDWVTAHRELIERVAEDPHTHREWTEADGPFQFYAFCREWAKLLAWCDSGKAQEDFVSSLPVAQDGTCNGLQHFAAMFRDPVGGSAVNLVPMDTPQDIYQRVADVVLERVKLEAPSNPLAKMWLESGLIGRSLCKTPTMTFGYGSNRYGFKDQLVVHCVKLKHWPELAIVFDSPKGCLITEACTLMATYIWDALGTAVVSAFEGMAWMKAAAKIVAKDSGQPVAWTVAATGLRVTQPYMVTERHIIDMVLAGKLRVRPSVYSPSTVVDWRKQTSAMAPNFVHSLDAAALMLTVNQAATDGIESFGMVHDSYATVAGDAEVMAKATREAFVRMYTDNDVVALLHADLSQLAVSPLPNAPAKGGLDLAAVIASDYFFA